MNVLFTAPKSLVSQCFAVRSSPTRFIVFPYCGRISAASSNSVCASVTEFRLFEPSACPFASFDLSFVVYTAHPFALYHFVPVPAAFPCIDRYTACFPDCVTFAAIRFFLLVRLS